MKTIEQNYIINSTLGEVWNCLIRPQEINSWGGGPAKMSDDVGYEFELWGGDIHGKNVDIVNKQQLVQDWISGDWEKPSRVTFTLFEQESGTRVHLLHENVPDEEAAEIEDGWNRYYLGAIKDYLESI